MSHRPGRSPKNPTEGSATVDSHPESPPKASGLTRWQWIIVAALVLATVAGGLATRRFAHDGDEFLFVGVPTYLTGLGTLLLALVTVFVAKEDRRRANQEREQVKALQREEAQARRDERKRAQAQQVASWPDWFDRLSPRLVAFPRSPEDQNPGNVWALLIRNSSPLPVWNVEVQFYKVGDEATASQRQVISLVAPGDSAVACPTELQNEATFEATISFRDTDKVRWFRNKVGVLAEDPIRTDRVAPIPEPLVGPDYLKPGSDGEEAEPHEPPVVDPAWGQHHPDSPV